MIRTINQDAVKFALERMDAGFYGINTVWKINAPTPEKIDSFKAEQGEEALSKWFLVVQSTDHGNEYLYPIGDFRNVHRSGVQVAKQEAVRDGDTELAEAADTILDMFDRMNAC